MNFNARKTDKKKEFDSMSTLQRRAYDLAAGIGPQVNQDPAVMEELEMRQDGTFHSEDLARTFPTESTI